MVVKILNKEISIRNQKDLYLIRKQKSSAKITNVPTKALSECGNQPAYWTFNQGVFPVHWVIRELNCPQYWWVCTFSQSIVFISQNNFSSGILLLGGMDFWKNLPMEPYCQIVVTNFPTVCSTLEFYEGKLDDQ